MVQACSGERLHQSLVLVCLVVVEDKVTEKIQERLKARVKI